MLSQRARYALRALTDLALYRESVPISAGAIAVRRSVPRKFLDLILLDLKAAGLVESQRGRTGGYRLARAPEAISFGEVVRLLDGPLALVPCVSQTAYHRCEDCADEATCGIRRAMGAVRDEAARILDAFTLADAVAGELARGPGAAADPVLPALASGSDPRDMGAGLSPLGVAKMDGATPCEGIVDA